MNNNLTKRVLSSIVILPISFFFIFKGSLIFLLFLFLLYLISSQEWFRMVTDIRLKIIGLIFLFLSFYFTYLARTENWKRPKNEINYLFNLLENFLIKEIDNLSSKNIKLKILGKKNF